MQSPEDAFKALPSDWLSQGAAALQAAQDKETARQAAVAKLEATGKTIEEHLADLLNL